MWDITYYYDLIDEATVDFAVNDKMYRLELEAQDTDVFTVSFELLNGEECGWFAGRGLDITHTGDAFRVFRKVLELIQDAIPRFGIRHLIFRSLEPSRTKLYNRMIKRYATNWAVETTYEPPEDEDDCECTTYTLIRK